MKKQQGITFIGIMIVLVIIAVLMGVMLSYASTAKGDVEARQFIEDARMAVRNSLKVKGNSDINYLALNLESRGLVPDEWDWEGNPAWPNAWVSKYGRTTIGGTGNWFGENPPGFGGYDGVHVFFQRVPYEICYQVLVEMAIDFDYIRFQNSTVKQHDIEFDRANASAACDTRQNQGYGVIRAAVFK